MALNPVCSRCGIELGEPTAQGYCPSCLLRDGLAAVGDPGPESGERRAEDGRWPTADREQEGIAPSPLFRRLTSFPSSFGDYELLEVIGRGGIG